MRACLQRTDFMRTSIIASLHSIGLWKYAAYAPYAVAEMGEDVCVPTVCGAGRLPVLLKNTKQSTSIAQHQEPHTSMHWTSLQHCLSE